MCSVSSVSLEGSQGKCRKDLSMRKRHDRSDQPGDEPCHKGTVRLAALAVETLEAALLHHGGRKFVV
jgi:hypothetical protein